MIDIFYMRQLEWASLLLISALLGGMIGWNRKNYGKDIGSRTFSLVSMGSTLFTIMSYAGFSGQYDATRIAASIAVGVGFLGAGVISRVNDRISGMTTAAGIWISAAIGICVGVGYWLTASIATIFTLLILELKRYLTKT